MLLQNRKMIKNPDNPSINVHKVEVIFLVFQFWALTWYKYQIVIHTDSITAITGLQNSILQGLANTLL